MRFLLFLLLASAALAAGAGTLPYASLFADGVTVACDVQSTYYEIPTWTVGSEYNADGQTDGDIVCTYAGTYRITASCSFDGDNGEEYHFCLFANGQEMEACEASNTAKAGSGVSVMACSVVTAVAAGVTLDMRCSDESGAGTFHLDEGQFSAVRIGP